MKFEQLKISDKIIIMEQLANEYKKFAGIGFCPSEFVFEINSKVNDFEEERQARFAAIKSFGNLNKDGQVIKRAFDTRHTDQEHERNPRTGLQYWHRSEAFIDENDEEKLRIFAKLMNCLKNLKTEFGNQPEWFGSYARILHDNVERILRVKQADLDIFKPQLAYLEQLIYARYRLLLEDIVKNSDADLKAKILSKDEELLKRGWYLKETGLISAGDEGTNKIVKVDASKDVSKNELKDSLANAIFNVPRLAGEKTVSRTITINITDTVSE